MRYISTKFSKISLVVVKLTPEIPKLQDPVNLGFCQSFEDHRLVSLMTLFDDSLQTTHLKLGGCDFVRVIQMCGTVASYKIVDRALSES